MSKKFYSINLVRLLLAFLMCLSLFTYAHAQVENPQSGTIGLEGDIPTDPPSSSPTISFPQDGATFNDTPIEVTGLCESGLVVKVFKNQVFAGSVQCADNGTFTITVDLFNGENNLVARLYDEFDQPGPDSNEVTVTYNSADVALAVDRVLLTTNFAKRGADPGQKLTWPVTVTGGVGPYAVKVDWGDGEESLFTVDFAGEFTAEHVYEKPGTYQVIVKATDSQDTSAFLQVIGVANGELDTAITSSTDEAGDGRTIYRVLRWPLYLMFVFMVSTFWLGRRYELRRFKQKLASQEYNQYR